MRRPRDVTEPRGITHEPRALRHNCERGEVDGRLGELQVDPLCAPRLDRHLSPRLGKPERLHHQHLSALRHAPQRVAPKSIGYRPDVTADHPNAHTGQPNALGTADHTHDLPPALSLKRGLGLKLGLEPGC